MSDGKPKQERQVTATIFKGRLPGSKIMKAEQSTQVDDEHIKSIAGNTLYIEKPYEIELLEKISRESTILPQCITAYKNNIPGFGNDIIPLKPVDDEAEKKELLKKAETATDEIEDLYLEHGLTESYRKLIDQVERYGYGGFEVIRGTNGAIEEFINIENMTYYFLTARDNEFTKYDIYRNGKKKSRKKKFRRIVQDTAGTNTVNRTASSTKTFYKEFGDPRVISIEDGKQLKEMEDDGTTIKIPVSKQANEIIWIMAEDLGVYGVPRYEGTILTSDGMRFSEKLNHKYFLTGRHIPLAVVVNGGTLSKGSFDTLEEYINGVEGEDGWNAFLLLEFDQKGGDTAISESEKATIELKEMSKILQKDELFTEYQENGRRKNQSAFMLNDLYTGYTKDYNVATAREAKKVVEEQVFQPQRTKYAAINNQVLWELGYSELQFTFKSASVENSEHQEKMFDSAIKAGALSPNQAAEEYYRSINKEWSKIEEEWADKPVHVLNAEKMGNAPAILDGIQKQIYKMEEDNVPVEVITMMKELKKEVERLSGK